MATDDAPEASWLVVCLCAAWCDVCTEYRSRFQQVQVSVQATHPQARFLWVDIEDEADLLEPLDVENFPTLLLACGTHLRFWGPMTPQAETLERMVRIKLQDPQAQALQQPEVTALVARIRAAHPSAARQVA